MIWRLFSIILLGLVNTIVGQSHHIKTEREKITEIEDAIKAEKHSAFMAYCEALLDRHRINAYAWFICGKHLLFVPESDPHKARANVKLAYGRLKIAADDFARTGRQTYFASDAQQFLGLAAMLLSDFDRAETHFKQVVARDNRIAAAWYNLGVLYEMKGLRDESMRAFDRYTRLKGANDAMDF